MTKPPGLVTRGRIWYYRARVPKDLIRAYKEREKWISLETPDYREALTRFHIVAAEKQAEYEAMRQRRERFAGLKKTDSDKSETFSVDREEAIAIARAYLAERLSTVESRKTARQYGEAAGDIRIELSAELGGLRDPDDDPVAYNTVYQEARALLKSQGYQVQTRQRLDGGFLDLVRRALAASYAIEIERLDGNFDDDPRDALFRGFSEAEYPTAATVNRRLNVQESVDKFWKDEITVEPKAAKTLVKYKAGFELLVRFLGGETLISRVSRDKLLQYRDAVSRLPSNYSKRFEATDSFEHMVAETERLRLPLMKFKTQEMYVVLMTRLFKWAANNGFISNQIALDIRPRGLKVPDAHKRRSFTIDELNAIFQAPVYTGCLDDERGYAKPGPLIIKRSRYWVPLIALFTGMRLGEILQLRVDNIRKSRLGTPFFFLTEDLAEDDEDKDFDGMELKTFASRREVPMHSLLIDAGFLEFVHRARKAGRAELFPEVPKAADGKKSTLFSKRFSRFLMKAGVKPDGSGNCFHMFRHTLRDALRRAHVSEEIADAVQGWSRDQKTGRSYGEGFEADTLAVHWEKLSLPDFRTEHLTSPRPTR